MSMLNDEANSERSDCELVEQQCNGWGGDE